LLAASCAAVALSLSVPARGEEKPKDRPGPQGDASVDHLELGEDVPGEEVKAEGRPPQGKDVDLMRLLEIWAKRLGNELVYDQSVVGVRLNMSGVDRTLTWGRFKAILDFHDVVVEERKVGDRWITFVHQRRNLAAKLPLPFRFVGPDALPERDEVVTVAYTVRHGAGNDIYAVMRGLLVRDQNRVANMLYVRGPELILIVDFASNVRYYLQVLRSLDVPAPERVLRAYKVRNAEPAHVAKVLLAVINQGGEKAATPALPASALPHVVVDERLSQLIVTGYDSQQRHIEELMRILDAEKPATPEKR
jgi:hypothetical protein